MEFVALRLFPPSLPLIHHYYFPSLLPLLRLGVCFSFNFPLPINVSLSRSFVSSRIVLSNYVKKEGQQDERWRAGGGNKKKEGRIREWIAREGWGKNRWKEERTVYKREREDVLGEGNKNRWENGRKIQWKEEGMKNWTEARTKTFIVVLVDQNYQRPYIMTCDIPVYKTYKHTIALPHSESTAIRLKIIVTSRPTNSHTQRPQLRFSFLSQWRKINSFLDE